MECQWDGTWSPVSQLSPCVWVACIEPPIPDNSTNLVRNYEGGSVVEFHSKVNYTCKDGYYFGADYNQQAFTLTCFTNGTVGGDDWAHCFHPSERFCFDPPAVPYNGGLSSWNEAQYSGARTPYATVVTYSCDLGRKLFNYSSEKTIMYDSANYTCQWDRTWAPETPPDDCEWVACIDPPLPEGHNLKNDFDGVHPYEFYTNATYTCEKEGYFFEQDRNMESFQVQCWGGGRWREPNPWPKCVTTVECGDPPGVPKAGSRKWDEKLNYGTTAEYECGPYATFANDVGNVTYKTATIECLWNKTWSPAALDNCTWLYCPVVPEPPPSSNLLYSAPNGSSLL